MNCTRNTIMTPKEIETTKKKIKKLMAKKEKLERKGAGLLFPDMLIESEIEDIEEELWELERSLE